MVYSEAFIEQALFKVYSRGTRSVKSVAEDLNVSYNKVQYWMKIKKSRTAVPEMPKARRPQDWAPEAVGRVA